jgi:hypothetical protein
MSIERATPAVDSEGYVRENTTVDFSQLDP